MPDQILSDSPHKAGSNQWQLVASEHMNKNGIKTNKEVIKQSVRSNKIKCKNK